jgi:hypothetical protein
MLTHANGKCATVRESIISLFLRFTKKKKIKRSNTIIKKYDERNVCLNEDNKAKKSSQQHMVGT